MMYSREIAFIDAGIDDIEALIAGLRPDVAPVLLSPYKPALVQMADALRGVVELRAIHIVAHGRPGEVAFASGALSVENLGAYSSELVAIGAALSERSGFNLWSCQTAKGESGRACVAALSRAAGPCWVQSCRNPCTPRRT